MISFVFRAKTWLYPGEGAWCFVTLPRAHGEKLKACVVPGRRGWGSLRVEARLNEVVWTTSIFPDRKSGSYLLPLKASVRKQAGIAVGQTVRVALSLHIP